VGKSTVAKGAHKIMVKLNHTFKENEHFLLLLVLKYNYFSKTNAHENDIIKILNF